MKRLLFPVIKWVARLSLTALLLLPALYYGSFRCGSLKFACMQAETQSMRDTWAIAFHPLTGIAINVDLALVTLFLAFMLADLCLGHSAGGNSDSG
jgi:hypothetical protein